MPPLKIKDPAVHDSLRRHRGARKDSRRLVEHVMRIARRASSRPVLNRRTLEEILGYDESGIPRR